MFKNFILIFLLSTPTYGNLVLLARDVQKLEEKLLVSQENIGLLQRQDQTLLGVLLENRNLFKTLARSIRYLNGISPLLRESQNHRETIRSLIILERFFPALQMKMVPVLPILQDLTSLRKDLFKRQGEQNRLRKSYQASLSFLKDALVKKYHLLRPSFPVPVISKDKEFNLESYISSIVTFFAEHPCPSVGKHNPRIHQPVVGTVLSKTPHLCIQSHPGFHVVSPWNAAVVGITLIPKKGYLVVLKQGEFFLMVSGMATVTCQEGEILTMGNPLGEMPCHPSELTLELREGFTLVDASLYVDQKSDV